VLPVFYENNVNAVIVINGTQGEKVLYTLPGRLIQSDFSAYNERASQRSSGVEQRFRNSKLQCKKGYFSLKFGKLGYFWQMPF
jgi:hypothetical protein